MSNDFCNERMNVKAVQYVDKKIVNVNGTCFSFYDCEIYFLLPDN